ncbi:MAG: nucleotidyltransferase family protein [Candidatus Dormibacteria bacterium]
MPVPQARRGELLTRAALVLAAGHGSRLGATQAKPLVAFRGRPLVLWQVEAALGAGLAEVVVVDGAANLAGTLPPAVTLLHNPNWADGQATSLQVGIGWCRRQGHEAVLVGLADQPLIPTRAWAAVARAAAAPIVIATYSGRRGHPVRLGREVWARLPQTGDEGARGLIAAHPELVQEVACRGEPADLDTEADLARWR